MAELEKSVEMKNIEMVDLKTQYLTIKEEVDQAMQEVILGTAFINGPAVKNFASNLSSYLNIKHIIPCANGTDALQAALMALNIPAASEIIIPAFNYVATAEVIVLLGFKALFCDVDPDTFLMDVSDIEKRITSNTKVIMPVHLFGQCVDMDRIMQIAEKHSLYVIEDNAQAIGSKCNYKGEKKSSGGIGHIGTTSFFPSKNLGCYGDGGAIFTQDDELASTLGMIVNHGQKIKYFYETIGINSRLDTIQAALLNVKLRYLDNYSNNRKALAANYDEAFADIEEIQTPKRVSNSDHVFHQYNLKIKNGKRDALKAHLAENKIPSMIYYPSALHTQKPYAPFAQGSYPVSEQLCKEVLALPMHTEMEEEQVQYIIKFVRNFFQTH